MLFLRSLLGSFPFLTWLVMGVTLAAYSSDFSFSVEKRPDATWVFLMWCMSGAFSLFWDLRGSYLQKMTGKVAVLRDVPQGDYAIVARAKAEKPCLVTGLGQIKGRRCQSFYVVDGPGGFLRCIAIQDHQTIDANRFTKRPDPEKFVINVLSESGTKDSLPPNSRRRPTLGVSMDGD